MQVFTLSDESNPKIVAENQYSRLVEVTYNRWAEQSQMYRLDLKINDQYIAVRRFDKSACTPPYDHEHTTLSRLMLECMNAQTQGYYSMYSGKLQPNEVHGDEYGCGHPIEEMDSRVMYEKNDELRKGMITFSKSGKGIYEFSGNHEHYSGAFWYIIWDKEMVKKIKSHLRKNYPEVLRRQK